MGFMLLVVTVQNEGMVGVVLFAALVLGLAGPAVVAWLDQWKRPAGLLIPFWGALFLSGFYVLSARLELAPALVLLALLSLGARAVDWWAVACLFAVGLVGLVSGGAGGAGPLREFLASMNLTEAGVEFWVFAVRKAVHLSAYGIFSFLVSRLMESKGSSRYGVWPALGWVLSVASFDELRQSFTPGRTGQFVDVLIDLTGATVALVGLHFFTRRKP